MGNLFNDITSDIDLPSDAELAYDTRRAKISMTTRAKLQHDPEFAELKKQAALKAAEIRRVVPLEDHVKLLEEYWSIKKQRPSRLFNIMAERYDVKPNLMEKIVTNGYNTVSADEYKQLVDQYYSKYPNQRSDSLRKAHAAMTEEQRAQKDLNISIAQDPVDADTAVAIYEQCKYNRTHAHYKAVAAKHLDKNGKKIPWEKVRDITNGRHYATQDFDIDADVKEYRLRQYGTFKFTSPAGKVFHFEDEKSCGEWMIKTNTTLKDDPYGVCTSIFYSTVPNTPKLMRRQFWKGWTIENIKKVDF